MNNLIRKFYIGIKNLIFWFPIIWRDRDWDYHYLLKVMSHKLHKMENFHREIPDDLSLNKSNQILELAAILDRIIENDYKSDVYLSDFKTSKFKKKKNNQVFVSKLTEEELEIYTRLLLDETNMIEKDIILFCEHLKNIRNWWK